VTAAADLAVLVDGRHDQTIRWQPGERMHHLAERWARERGRVVAVDTGQEQVTFAELDARANQLARHLRRRGVGPDDRVALLLDSALRSYVAILAVGKLGAAFVPLDAGFPVDRVGFILSDAEVRTVVTVSSLTDHVEGVGAPAVTAVCVDTDAAAIAAADRSPLAASEVGAPRDELAYLIYTSGTSGRPKGVAIEHAAIVNFVRVAGQHYGYRPGDRVYQGMTIAFDFSVEELWVPWAAGATVVPKPPGTTLLGDDLQQFILDRGITAIACVPTLLATLDESALESLRLILVSGEACPQDLVKRWHRPDRRFLNVYGPTEATVTCTWGEVAPDRPVTLGRPLPTYSIVLLDTDGSMRAVAPGEYGEIAVAGIGLARGYLNLPEKTAAAFVPDTLGMPANPGGTIYRTGDLGRVTEDGEIEYHGRIDLQVKIRGYRIELTEIESVVLADPGVAAAVVDTWSPREGQKELVGYFSVRPGADVDEVRARVRSLLRDRLPGYMVPPYLEHLEVIPLTTNDKADRAALPPPSGSRVGGAGTVTAASGPTETTLVAALAPLLGLEPDQISVTAHLFEDLGASSLSMAGFSTALRQAGVRVSITDIYRNPTIRELALSLEDQIGQTAADEGEPVREPYRAPAAKIALTGLVQAGLFVGLAWGLYAVIFGIYDLLAATAVSTLGSILRAIAISVGAFGLAVLGPVVAKWVLMGRVRETEFTAWSVRYLRFWVMRTLLRANVMVLFAGTPVFTTYMRLLGAKIGPRVLYLPPQLPLAPDMISIGADSVIRKDVVMPGYTVEGGRLRTGRVTIGRRAFVGEAAVLEVGSSMGDDTQLAHASSLHGQHVPDGERWHGSPARKAGDGADFARLEATSLPWWRRTTFGLVQFLQVVLILIPLFILAFQALLAVNVGGLAIQDRDPSTGVFWLVSWALSTLGVFTGLFFAILFAAALPRLLNLLVEPGRVYPLYSFRYAIQRATARVSNIQLLNMLFGDSSAITTYLRVLGWNLGLVEQTGSNFGTNHKQENPLLSSVGRGTMVSDGLSMGNAEFSSTGFRLLPVDIGDKNFLGNHVIYPSGGRTGQNVLLATKVLVPLDGPVHENTGLLGSPAFVIPRSVQRDTSVLRPARGLELRTAIRAKNKHNIATVLIMLATNWVASFLGLSILLAGVTFIPRFGSLALAVSTVLGLVTGMAWLVICERAAMGFRRLRPRFCSIYDPYFWRHERLWKLMVPGVPVLDGTPFKAWVLRGLGVRVGRGLLDHGSSAPEHSLVSLGDDVTLAQGAVIQCHSLEDGTFKSDHSSVGDGATVALNGFVHYGVHIGAGAVIDADAFVMKGTEVPAGARWRGNPAVQITD
jgi:non-ribosomal peptide synthetase-like protein